MKKNRRPKGHPKPPPISVEVPAIMIDTFPLLFPNGERWTFNVTRARQIVRVDAMREIYRLDHAELWGLIKGFVAGKSIPREEIDQADARIPGIGAVIDYGGQRRLNLIDGLERAIKAYVTSEGFPLYVLTDDERDRCLWSKTGLAGIAEKVARGDF